MPTHRELDERSLALHRLIADKIRKDPALFNRAQATLARWRNSVCTASQPYLMEWERLTAEGIDACLAIALEDSQRAADLRQSSPLATLLTNQERFAFLRQWGKNHAAQRA